MGRGTDLMGKQARALQDAANGTTEYVTGMYKVRSAGSHVVDKALRRGIADAYAAFVGQVDMIPNDAYGLALYALDKTYSPKPKTGLTGTHAFNLNVSPFSSSKSKHAAICSAAHHIMKTLDAYVHEVVPFCPPELKHLMQRPPIRGQQYMDHPTSSHMLSHLSGRQPAGAEGSPSSRRLPGWPSRGRQHKAGEKLRQYPGEATFGQHHTTETVGSGGHGKGSYTHEGHEQGVSEPHTPRGSPAPRHQQQQSSSEGSTGRRPESFFRDTTAKRLGLPARMVPSRPAAAHIKYADAARPAAAAAAAAAGKDQAPAGAGGHIKGASGAGGKVQQAAVMNQQAAVSRPGATGATSPGQAPHPAASQPQDPGLDPTAAAAVAAVTASAAAAAAEKAERQDNAYGRAQARSARALLGSGGGSAHQGQQRPLSAPAAGGHVSSSDGHTSSSYMSDPRVLEALARARLPKVTRLPPHMHVSSYYDHVKPAMPLEQVHAKLAAGAPPMRAPSPGSPHHLSPSRVQAGGPRQQSVSPPGQRRQLLGFDEESRRRAAASGADAGGGGGAGAGAHQQVQGIYSLHQHGAAGSPSRSSERYHPGSHTHLEEADDDPYPYRGPSVSPDSRRRGSHMMMSHSGSGSYSAAPGSSSWDGSVSSALGFTVTDEVLLRLIGMHKGMAAKARKRELHIPDSAPLPPFDTMSAWGATSPSHGSHTHGSSPTQGAAVAASIAAMSAAAGGGQDIPFIPDNSQGYLFDVKGRRTSFSPGHNRSRRLAPSNAELHYSSVYTSPRSTGGGAFNHNTSGVATHDPHQWVQHQSQAVQAQGVVPAGSQHPSSSSSLTAQGNFNSSSAPVHQHSVLSQPVLAPDTPGSTAAALTTTSSQPAVHQQKPAGPGEHTTVSVHADGRTTSPERPHTPVTGMVPPPRVAGSPPVTTPPGGAAAAEMPQGPSGSTSPNRSRRLMP